MIFSFMAASAALAAARRLIISVIAKEITFPV
jgi:hypothetical protein